MRFRFNDKADIDLIGIPSLLGNLVCKGLAIVLSFGFSDLHDSFSVEVILNRAALFMSDRREVAEAIAIERYSPPSFNSRLIVRHIELRDWLNDSYLTPIGEGSLFTTFQPVAKFTVASGSTPFLRIQVQSKHYSMQSLLSDLSAHQYVSLTIEIGPLLVARLNKLIGFLTLFLTLNGDSNPLVCLRLIFQLFSNVVARGRGISYSSP
jgi:hypothetical protein